MSSLRRWMLPLGLLLFLWPVQRMDMTAAAAAAAEDGDDGRHYCETPAEWVAEFEAMLHSRTRLQSEDWLKYLPGPAMLDAREIEGLLLLMESKEPEARQWACLALGRRREKSAVEGLLRHLADENEKPNVREDAAVALGMIGDPRTVEPLLAILKDTRDTGETVVATATVRIKDPSGKVVEPAPAGDPPPLPPLVVAPEDPARKAVWFRHRVAEALGRLRDPRAIEPLIAALPGRSGYTRRYAAWALGQFADPRAAEPLRQVLGEPDEYARREIVLAVGRCKGVAAYDFVLGQLKDGVASVRPAAAESLGWMGDKRAVGPLLEALKDAKDSPVREKAAESLGRLGDAQAIGALKAALGDRARPVRAKAAKALYDLKDPQGLEALFTVFGDAEEGTFDHSVTDCFGAMGKDAIPHLLAGLGHKSYRVRSNSAQAFGRLELSCTDELVRAMANPDPKCAWLGAMAIFNAPPDPKAIAPLVQALDSRDGSTVGWASGALGKIGRAATPAVIQRANANPRAPNAFAPMCRIHDLKLVPVLIQYLSHEDPAVRAAAVGALGNQYSNQASAAVAKMLGDPSETVRVAAMESLRGVSSRTLVAALGRALGDPAVKVRQRAAYILASSPRIEALAELERRAPAETDPDVKKTLQTALEVTRKQVEYKKHNEAARQKGDPDF